MIMDREDHAKGGGIYLDVGYVISGGDTCSTIVWFRLVGHVGGDNKNGGGNEHIITPEDHGAEGKENNKRDVDSG